MALHTMLKEYDAMRDEYLKSLGLVVIQFDVDENRIQMQKILITLRNWLLTVEIKSNWFIPHFINSVESQCSWNR